MEPTTTPETRTEPLDDDEAEPRPLSMVIIAAIVALAVGGLAGFAVGFKVEQNRVKSDNKKTTAATTPAQTGARRAQPAGEITAVTGESVTIRNARGKNRVINVSASTVIDKTSSGGAADLTQGAAVLVQGQAAADGTFDASEIIVLPPGSKFAAGGA